MQCYLAVVATPQNLFYMKIHVKLCAFFFVILHESKKMMTAMADEKDGDGG